MKIAPIMKGFNETTTHILMMDKKELDTLMAVFSFYTKENKRKITAKKMYKQFEDELQIYTV